MIININRKFIFVANLRAASTALENCLTARCGILINESSLGKHFCVWEMQERYNWLFNTIPLDNFFVFGVLRDPLFYLVSLYNFHRQDIFDKEISSTKALSFEDFYYKWIECEELQWQVLPQIDRFRDLNKQVRGNYFIRYRDLDRQFKEICNHLELPEVQVPVDNVSPKAITAEDVSSSCVKDIAQRYKEDYYYLENMTGKFLK